MFVKLSLLFSMFLQAYIWYVEFKYKKEYTTFNGLTLTILLMFKASLVVGVLSGYNINSAVVAIILVLAVFTFVILESFRGGVLSSAKGFLTALLGIFGGLVSVELFGGFVASKSFFYFLLVYSLAVVVVSIYLLIEVNPKEVEKKGKKKKKQAKEQGKITVSTHTMIMLVVYALLSICFVFSLSIEKGEIQEKNTSSDIQEYDFESGEWVDSNKDAIESIETNKNITSHSHDYESGNNGTTGEAELNSDETEQSITIVVDGSGYTPANVRVRSGIPLKINFKVEEGATSNKVIHSHDLFFDVTLNEGDNIFTMEGLSSGVYNYISSDGEFSGRLMIE